MSSSDVLKLDSILKQLDELTPRFSAFGSYEVVDRTDLTLKVRIPIAEELHVQLYANSGKGKLNLSLVHGGQRIYGEDSEGGIEHVHPFEDPESHTETTVEPSLEDFLAKVQQHLEEKGLI